MFKPTFLALFMFLVVTVMAMMRDLTSQNMLAIAVGLGAAVLGGALGSVLRRWEKADGK
ncbi:hypothetical protein RXV86_15950 [Alisedimentitalea sp. MJ-SS2]|uniref:hypothetical protein n=1 Tax=Aliisedimentitalea sp. MJ-SS2 TaxID=3049795 RepID=UPI00290EC9E7|nr:hypothetical protein [Alisedimentitalea sp. MJ-SS2]MDU8928886.1 hypothetical protein [Alisedimentitalea sp. MJ-SS2]